MSKGILTLIILAAVVGGILFFAAAYTVDETEQAIITQFGKPVGEPILVPGIHFKKPFIQAVHLFEKRVMEWDSDHREIPTKDKKFIKVDATARWRIKDALKYYKTVKTEVQAQTRLDDIVGGATKDAISRLELIESVRTSTRAFAQVEDEFRSDYNVADFDIEVGRHKIGERIKEQSNPRLEAFGIELVDVRLRRINYVETVRREVYQRMISERNQIAEFYRSEGLGKQMEIEGKREKDLKVIQSEAYRQAEEIRGQADAEATRIYADTYNADPEFYAFMKTLESYEATLDGSVSLILSTDSDYFKYFKTMGQ